MTRILVLVGTPLPDSLTHALAAAYVEAARGAGADVRIVDLAVDPIPPHPTDRNQLRMPRSDADIALDPDVARYIDDVAWADHLVVLHPQWWGTAPAALKAFIDRVFVSGFAFRYRPAGRLWDKLLTGRTARLVMTMDSPRLWNRLVYRSAAETSMTRAIFGYCGIRTVGVTRLSEVRHRTDAARASWLPRVAAFGVADARRTGSTASRRGEAVPTA